MQHKPVLGRQMAALCGVQRMRRKDRWQQQHIVPERLGKLTTVVVPQFDSPLITKTFFHMF